MKAFHCYEPEERQIKVTQLFASLMTYETFFDEKEADSNDDSDGKVCYIIMTLSSLFFDYGHIFCGVFSVFLWIFMILSLEIWEIQGNNSGMWHFGFPQGKYLALPLRPYLQMYTSIFREYEFLKIDLCNYVRAIRFI